MREGEIRLDEWKMGALPPPASPLDKRKDQNVSSSSSSPPRLITLGLSSSRSSVTFPPPAVKSRSSTMRLLASRAVFGESQFSLLVSFSYEG